MKGEEKPILVVGTLGYQTNKLDGQTVKTRNIVRLLKAKYCGEIKVIDTLYFKQNIVVNTMRMLYNLLRCKTVIMVPASNSFNVLLPLLYILSKVFRFHIILLCVGGWQMEFFNGSSKYKAHPYHLKICKKIKAFMPEIDNVTTELVEKYGFRNCETFTNFRIVDSHQEIEDDLQQRQQLRLVFMARIHKLKGYDIIFTFAQLIKELNLDICIDFYGPINDDDESDFKSKVRDYEGIVNYNGVLQPEEINHTLSNYDILLLPTRYFTEGVPGTIIDAYAARVPVIVTNWKHAKEVVINGVSGIIVDFNEPQEEFNEVIIKLYNDRLLLNKMKQGTSIGLKPYSAETAWIKLEKYL